MLSLRIRYSVIAAALLVPAGLRAQATSARGEIAGVVRDSLGDPIAGVEIQVRGDSARVRSAEDGSFRLVNRPAGDQVLEARRIGFRPSESSVTVAPGRVASVQLRLHPLAVALPTVRIAARVEAFDGRLEGFRTRSAGRRSGHFITRERLDRVSNYRFLDVLRELPGVRIVQNRSGPMRSVRLRGATASCWPMVWLDGAPASAGEFDLDMLQLNTVEGIEVYPSSSTVPVEFSAARSGGFCGVIAVWTRPARPAARRRYSPAGYLERVLAEQGLATAADVDSAARPREETLRPVYPDSLWRQQIAGRVVAEFVVDTLGRVERESVGIVSASDAQFAEAVRAALEVAEFEPAWRRGRRVRQYVQHRFVFDPTTESRSEPLQGSAP